MQMVKIQIPDKTESATALAAMIRRGRILCFRDDTYIVPEPALDLLKQLGITHKELGRGGMDYAEKALRDSLASKTQRRATR